MIPSIQQHYQTMNDHSNVAKNVFLNDPKSQKKVFGHFLDLDNVFQHWATLPDHVGGPVGMNEVRIGVVGMGALGETSKSQTSRINQASNKMHPIGRTVCREVPFFFITSCF